MQPMQKCTLHELPDFEVQQIQLETQLQWMHALKMIGGTRLKDNTDNSGQIANFVRRDTSHMQRHGHARCASRVL